MKVKITIEGPTRSGKTTMIEHMINGCRLQGFNGIFNIIEDGTRTAVKDGRGKNIDGEPLTEVDIFFNTVDKVRLEDLSYVELTDELKELRAKAEDEKGR